MIGILRLFQLYCMASSAAGSKKNSKPTSQITEKRLSKINHTVNVMTVDQLEAELRNQQLPFSGGLAVQRARLKNHRKAQLMFGGENPLSMIEQEFRFVAVIDFEATCERENDGSYQHEIIEFPIVLIDTEQQKIVDQFRSYCRPTINPVLSQFCTELTGIEQHQVDAAPRFPEVLLSVEAWLKQHNLLSSSDKHQLAFATDGPWDFAKFLHSQCNMSELPYPRWARKWINVRKEFSHFYSTRRGGIQKMLLNLGLTFDGHCHSGLDDSINIARIAVALIKDGCVLSLNDGLHESDQNFTAGIDSRSKTNDELDDQIVFQE